MTQDVSSARRAPSNAPPPMPPHLTLAQPLEVLLTDGTCNDARQQLEDLLPAYLPAQRWFGFKDQTIQGVQLRAAMRLSNAPLPAYLAILRVDLPEREAFFLLPLALAQGEEAHRLWETRPCAPLAWIDEPDEAERQLLHDATANPAFWLALMAWWQSEAPAATPQGRFMPRMEEETRTAPIASVRVFGGEQSNSSAVFDDRFYMKLYRRLEPGIHPEPELLNHLTHAGFRFAPELLGTLALERPERPFALGILQQAIPVETDGWTYARQQTGRMLERLPSLDVPDALALPDRYDDDVPAWLDAAASEMLALARLLGRRTAELHRALAAADTPALRPVTGTPEDTRAFLQRVRDELACTRRSLDEHAETLNALPSDDAWQHGQGCLDRLAATGAACPRMRVHGDYHLGQVVRADGEFYLLDFEGEPTRSLDERRARDSNLRDVAGMLRSLEYAVFSAARDRPTPPPDGIAYALVRWCRAQFLRAYYATAGAAAFLPPPNARRLFLWAYLFHKALYEVRYELSHRPNWTWLPLRGLHHLLDEAAALNEASAA